MKNTDVIPIEIYRSRNEKKIQQIVANELYISNETGNTEFSTIVESLLSRDDLTKSELRELESYIFSEEYSVEATSIEKVINIMRNSS